MWFLVEKSGLCVGVEGLSLIATGYLAREDILKEYLLSPI